VWACCDKSSSSSRPAPTFFFFWFPDKLPCRLAERDNHPWL
jgi:hypothetical protein